MDIAYWVMGILSLVSIGLVWGMAVMPKSTMKPSSALVSIVVNGINAFLLISAALRW